MERLTGWDGDRAYICNLPIFEIEAVALDLISAVVYRLAAYEDTGLEPEDVEEAKEAVGRMAIELAYYHKAEAEGRLLVLPCKVGGELWVNDRDGKPRKMVLDAPDIRCHCAKEDNLCMALCDSPNAGICAYRLKNDGTDFGKTIYLTREEAEAKLKERDV